MFYFATDTNEFSRLALGAVYYAAGRMTYMPKCVQDVLQRNVAGVLPETADIINEYLDERHAEGQLGMDFDDADWMRFRERFVGEAHSNTPYDAVFECDDDCWLFIGAAFRYDLRFENGDIFSPEEYASMFEDHIDVMNEKWYANFMRDMERPTTWNPNPLEYFAAPETWDCVENVLRAWYDERPAKDFEED